jgi:hypothetical protein
MINSFSIIFQISDWLITILAVDVYIGISVAVIFLVFGIDQIDPAAKNSYGFRILIFPGLVLFWPLVIWRWWILLKSHSQISSPVSEHIKIHTYTWIFLLMFIPTILGITLYYRYVSDIAYLNSRMEAFK